jgi:hypothetical protein
LIRFLFQLRHNASFRPQREKIQQPLSFDHVRRQEHRDDEADHDDEKQNVQIRVIFRLFVHLLKKADAR